MTTQGYLHVDDMTRDGTNRAGHVHTDSATALGGGTAVLVVAGLQQHYDRGAQGAQEGKAELVVH